MPPSLYTALGFYSTPELHLPVAVAGTPDQPLRLSPLQVALAAAALSHDGLRPPPRLAMAVKTPSQGWVVLPPLSEAGSGPACRCSGICHPGADG